MEWNAVMPTGPEAPDDELLERSATELEDFLTTHPDAPEQVLDIVRARLAKPLDAETWQRLNRSLGDYVGPDAATLLLWSAVVDTDDEDRTRRFERVAATGRPAATELVRLMRGELSYELQEAWDVMGQLPHNWRTIEREVYSDLVRDRPYLRFTIKKFNGEEATLEGSGDSFLNLTRSFMLALMTLGDRSAYSEGTVEGFLADANQLVELLQTPVTAEAPADPAPATVTS
jgi:hypothetical protein